MLTVLRTVVDVQKVFSFTAQNALIVRAEADTMALVEKLISDLDKARSEVIIDVMVMEVNTTHMRQHHRRVCLDRAQHQRYFCAAAGNHNAWYSERNQHHIHHPDHYDDRDYDCNDDNADHHHRNNDGRRHTDQHECSAECAEPHFERRFFASPACRAPRSKLC